jgi:hypothetical protein
MIAAFGCVLILVDHDSTIRSRVYTSTPEFKVWVGIDLQERTELAGLLQVTSGVKDVLTSAILLAGPLISSAFSMFLPGPPC